MNSKIKVLREKMKIYNLEGMIISNPINLRYILGSKMEGLLMLTRKENIFLTDGRYIEEARKTITIEDEINVLNYKDISEYDYERFFNFCENVGFEENYVTYAKYKEYKQRFRVNNFEETEGVIEKQRAIKDKFEIVKIRKACEITDECFEYIKKFIKVGKTEIEIANEIERFMLQNGAEDLAFETIVASGPNSSKPHAVPTERKITKGDVIILDFGCKYKGYCSDMTRTVFMGYIQDKVKKVYENVIEIKEKVEKELAEGKNLKNIAKLVQNEYEIRRFNLIHSIGHGVGLEVHELPFVSTTKETILKNNMIITNEPGIYEPGNFGIRVEDTVLIEKNSCVNLTKSPREITILE